MRQRLEGRAGVGLAGVVGAILAGGAGRRMGGAKATRPVAGRPLLAYPADALGAACDLVAVVCKPGAVLPEARGAWELWDDEPPEPRHPAAGIAHALARAGGPVLVCAADMPFVTAAECRRLVEAFEARPGAAAAVAVRAATDGSPLEPLLAVYAPAAAAPLREAAERGDPLRSAVEALGPVRVELPAGVLRSVDTPEALAAAEREIVSRAGARR